MRREDADVIDAEVEQMQGSRWSGAGVAFVVLTLLLQLVVAGLFQTVRRGLLWTAVGFMAAAFVAVGLVGSVAARAR
jgi:FtsH-binding integral membrane protein